MAVSDRGLGLLVKMDESVVECGQSLIAGRVPMQITINLPPDLEQYLLRQSAQSNLPLSLIVLQVLRQFLQISPISVSQWPDAVLAYEPSPDFPEFESYRDELISPQEVDLF